MNLFKKKRNKQATEAGLKLSKICNVEMHMSLIFVKCGKQILMPYYSKHETEIFK
jgi:hypothetical protein